MTNKSKCVNIYMYQEKRYKKINKIFKKGCVYYDKQNDKKGNVD